MATLMANDGGGGKTSPASLNSPRYWLVMDFEATCEDGDRRWPNEIIEWPCVLVDAETKATVDEFRSFVRPTERPSLTPFCTRLTSITQADVMDAPPLPEVLAAFDAWLRSYGASEDDGTALSVWCGDWDLATCLPRECARKGLDGAVPPVLRRWCNVKLPFVEVAAGSSKKRQGMDGMLRALSLPLDGHHHLGIDDARNIAKIAVELARRGGDRCIAPTSRSPPRPQIYRGKKGNGGGDGCSGGGGRPRGFGTKRAGGDGGVSGSIGCKRGGSHGSGGRDAAATHSERSRRAREVTADTLRRLDRAHPSVAATTFFGSADLAQLQARALAKISRTKQPPQPTAASVEVVLEDTISACVRLARTRGIVPCALNYASAKNPGGGFAKGSAGAQEEALCRSSNLFACLDTPLAMAKSYGRARSDARRGLYHTVVAHSPAVPLFRDNDGTLLAEVLAAEEAAAVEAEGAAAAAAAAAAATGSAAAAPRAAAPIAASFLTCPAPNAGDARKKGVGEDEITAALEERCAVVVHAAAARGERHLVLGSFGCGVFKNDVRVVARAFRAALQPHLGHLASAASSSSSSAAAAAMDGDMMDDGASLKSFSFRSVTFAVVDEEHAAAFRGEFSGILRAW